MHYYSRFQRQCRTPRRDARSNPWITSGFLTVFAFLLSFAFAPTAAAEDLSCELDGPHTLCQGETAKIRATVHGCDGEHEASFDWTISSGLQIVNGGGNDDDDITVRATGTGSQTVTLEVSCDGITCHPCEITINVPEAPVCDIDQPVEDPVCGSTGNTLHVDISGGDAPYDITWSLNSAAQNDNWAITGGQGTSTITYRAGNGSADATFTVTVRDDKGCESQCQITVSCGQAGPCVEVDAGGPYEQCVPVNCPPNTHCVQLNGTIGGQATSGTWTTSGSGNFLPNANTIDALYCPSQADLAAGQVTLTLTTNDPAGDCGPDSDQAVVVILEAPTCDIDFPSQNPVCGSTGNTLHVDISGGDSPYDITWSINSAGLNDNWAITGGQGTSTITYRAGNGEDATFTVTVRDDKGCESQCTITLSCGDAGPCVDVDAGGPYEKCVPADCPPNEHCIQLNGTIGGQATSGTWTTSGSGTFLPNPNTIDALYCPSAADLAAGQVTLTLTTNDPSGDCGPESDQVVVTLNEGPACTINQPSSNPVCGSTGNSLHVNISGGDSPYTITWSLDSAAQNDDWAITGGQGTSTITYRAGDSGTDATFRVVVRDEQGCESECTIHISCGEAAPCDVRVDAGGPYEECVPEGASPSQHCVQLNASIGGLATSGHWTTSGSGFFQPSANTIDATYCPSASDINNGQVTLTLTTNDPAGECDEESDQVVVYFNDAPVCDIDAPSSNPVCGSTGNTLHVDISGGDAPYTITWSINSAGMSDDWAITGGQGTSTITYRAGDTGTDATFTVKVKDEQGCESQCSITFACGEGAPCPNGPVCDIDNPSQNPECESVGNTLHVDISGGNPPYDIDWSINAAGLSDDWAITAGNGTSTITYRAGVDNAVFTVTVTDEDDCETTCTITLDCDEEGECPDVCTVTQGYWGNEGGKKCFEGQRMGTLEILEELITPGSPIVVGIGGRSITFGDGSEECIIQLLPGGGTPQALPTNFGNVNVNAGSCEVTGLSLKDGRINNSLLAQALTLALNLRLSPDLGDLDLTSSCSSVDLNSTWEDKLDDLGLDTTVEDVLELANRALAGESVGLSASAITDLLSRINEGFGDDCDDCGDDDENGDDDGVDLLGNDPNPVSVTGSTLIRFSLLEASTVHLDVFDITGRRVATLANGVFPAGESSARFDAASYPGLSSGIYMYRLSAHVLQTGATHVKADKMLLVR